MTKSKKDQVLEVLSAEIENVSSTNGEEEIEYTEEKRNLELFLFRLKEKISKVLNS